MKHHTHIYPRGANQWWCGGHLAVGQECWHITSASAEVCDRNPTRYPSPSEQLGAASVDTLAAATGQSRKDAWWHFDQAKRRLYATDGPELTGFENASGEDQEVFIAATGPTLPEIVEMLMGCAKCVSETRCAIGACLKARLAVRICIERQRG